MTPLDLRKISQTLLITLPSRQKEVVERRFGLKKSERETLEEIGQDHDVCRERIRQIQELALGKLRQEAQKTAKIFVYLKDHLNEWGGLRREEMLLRDAGKQKFSNEVFFLLHLGEEFEREKESDLAYAYWFVEQAVRERLEEALGLLEGLLQDHGQPLPFADLYEKAGQADPLFEDTSEKNLLSFLETARRIEQGPTGHWGLVSWAEIMPRGVRDKALIVFKKAKRPLHFREVADQINKFFLQKGWDSRTALPQTVHNELIKDTRFVLVGRGLYALRDWGFQEGTVREVIAQILEQKKKPLSQKELLAEVKKQRLVKENTILLNLANRDFFRRTPQNKYTLA